MASSNRATQINKVLKFAKKRFKPTEIPSDRTVLEHLIFACCAENSLHHLANQVYASLAADYYDWNEVHVTSIRELTDVMKPLNDPKEAATRLKRVLQSVFETHYSFDLEPMKKQNIGATVKQIEKYNGTSSYTVAFVTQNALGGHSIPINRGLLESMRVVGVVSDVEAAKGSVPGLERAIPKSKGAEISTMLHQLGVELYRSPYGPTIRRFLLEIEPSCKDRLPKRPGKASPLSTKGEEPAPAKGVKAKPAAADTEKKVKIDSDARSSDQRVPGQGPTKKGMAKKPAAKAVAKAKKKAAKKSVTKVTDKKKPAKKSAAAKKSTTTKTTTSKQGPPVKKKPTTKQKGGKVPAAGSKKKSVTKKLSKRKPK